MRSQNFQKIALLAIFLLVLQARSVQATTIDPLIWEQMVLDSEFIGIAECEWAGGIVARYRVIESWKGMPAGTRFNLRVATNYWGPQFPVTYAGEKYLITSYKSHVPATMMSTTSGNPVPLWWRNIPAEYHLPLWQGRVRLPLTETKNPLGPLGSEHPDLNSFKKAVDELLALNPEGREVRLLQALAKKYIFARLDDRNHPPEFNATIQRFKLAQQKIQGSSSAREIVSELLNVGRSHPKDLHYGIGTILSQGGGAITLQLLKSNSFTTIWEDQQYQRILADIERRLGLGDVPKEASEVIEREQPPAKEQLSQMRRILNSGPTSEQFGDAFDLLTVHDPGPVAKYLIKWTNPQKHWSDADLGYVIGSFFAASCGKDREVHLQSLFRAQDPFIRVAGAVYLTFENPTLGMASLEEFMKLPGDPGVWAALNLARRGRKTAVTRALEVFATSGPRGHMSGVHHENLQLRLIILLSNSAAVSSLSQPRPPNEPGYDAGADALKKYQESVYRYYAEWWQANQSKIQLYDPWLKLLEAQKVD